jgi:ribosome maturation factor RimP
MAVTDRVQELIAPLLSEADLDLYDIEMSGGVLRILVDRPGGADIGTISQLARTVNRALDEHDPIAGEYTVEVSSPGLERPLRTPAHFAAAIGERVKVKTNPGVEGDRRLEGTLTAADGTTVTVTAADGTDHTVVIDDIERARTTFEWGPANPKKGKQS